MSPGPTSPGTRDRDRPDHVYRVVSRVTALLFRLLRLDLRVTGAEHLPRTGAAVIASNHIGFLDFTFVGYAARERGRLVRFMSKREIFDLPLVGWAMRRMGHIRVDRTSGARAYRVARRELTGGEVVGVFPEATISRSWRLKPFRHGAAGLALTRGVPLVPCVLWGSQRVATVDGRRSLRPHTVVSITYGAPLLPTEGESVVALTDRLHRVMETLLDEAIAAYPQTPRGDADRWWLPHDLGGTAPDIAAAADLDRAALARLGIISD